MGILQTVAREHVPFNPANAVHRAAFWQLRTTGKQDERLRFILAEGYGSVLTMMQDRLACHFSKPKEVKEKPVASFYDQRVVRLLKE